ncbi:MAG: hypothetical protein KJT03_24680, partial [Verrucomicrobiae bacterium]|nr:hypothetical protein [Verrucomicrobiae bacterium]
MALQSDGNVILGGGFTSNPQGQFDYLARFNTHGGRDAMFPVNSAPDDIVYAVENQVNKSVVAVGTFKTLGAQPRLGFARFVESSGIDPGTITTFVADPEGSPALTLRITPHSSNGSITSVVFQSSTDGYQFEYLGNALPSNQGTWTYQTGNFPNDGWLRAVVTDVRAAQATSHAVGLASEGGNAPVLNLPPRIYGKAFDPFVYDVTASGSPTAITAEDLPGWALDDPQTGFNAETGVFQIRGVPPVPGYFNPTFT